MSLAPVYGAHTIKRERRTKAQVGQLDQQILAMLTEDHPQTVRHVRNYLLALSEGAS